MYFPLVIPALSTYHNSTPHTKGTNINIILYTYRIYWLFHCSISSCMSKYLKSTGWKLKYFTFDLLQLSYSNYWIPFLLKIPTLMFRNTALLSPRYLCGYNNPSPSSEWTVPITGSGRQLLWWAYWLTPPGIEEVLQSELVQQKLTNRIEPEVIASSKAEF